jgi:ribosome biogenesis GTPase / thiamine phosphate phosphatase
LKGRVTKSTGSWYIVKLDDGTALPCRIKGLFRTKGIKSTNPVAVGDWVEVEPESDGKGVITKLYDRKNYIIRRSVNLSKRTQIIASNIDQAVLITSLVSPKTMPGFVDRFLITAEAYNIPAVIIFNKTDLYNPDEMAELEYLEVVYGQAGYKTLRTSATKQINIEAFKNILKDKTSLISGNSGVGKSTLVNAAEYGLNLRTQQISDYHQQGMHTTTFAEMFDLSFGGAVIDTPGIKGFGLVEMDKAEIGDYFPEIFNLKKKCRFHNCLHINEPGCAVLQAVENNELAPTRYESYFNIINGIEDENAYRKDDYA